ncbi:MAG TPA: hypothetical protein VK009_29340 [Chloroflexota bacterium]|nr:hypothetical protein [Chloroflexota bacterium]
MLSLALLALAACGPAGSTEAPSASGAAIATSSQSASVPPQPHVTVPGKIAFARGGNIWVFVGSEAHQATTTPGAGDPSWSPDGNILAFDRQDRNSADLFVMPYPQGGPKQLSNNTNRVVENNLWEMQPDWSPDALSLAYVSDRGRLKNGVLDPAPWRITIATGARAQLANSNQYAGGVDLPRWRPDHKNELLYTSWAYDSQTLQPYGQLMLEDTQTSQVRALTPPNETSFQGDWSPDGKNIVYIKRQQQHDDIWLMTPSDSAPGTPTAGAGATSKPLLSGRFAQPVWSPDGRAIAYIGLKDGSLDLFVQNLTAELEPDGQPTQLTTGMHLEGASAISWGR